MLANARSGEWDNLHLVALDISTVPPPIFTTTFKYTTTIPTRGYGGITYDETRREEATQDTREVEHWRTRQVPRNNLRRRVRTRWCERGYVALGSEYCGSCGVGRSLPDATQGNGRGCNGDGDNNPQGIAGEACADSRAPRTIGVRRTPSSFSFFYHCLVVVKVQEQHMIAIKLDNDTYLWVQCESAALYSRMMEREFHIDLIKKNNPRRWRRLVYQRNPNTKHTWSVTE